MFELSSWNCCLIQQYLGEREREYLRNDTWIRKILEGRVEAWFQRTFLHWIFYRIFIEYWKGKLKLDFVSTFSQSNISKMDFSYRIQNSNLSRQFWAQWTFIQFSMRVIKNNWWLFDYLLNKGIIWKISEGKISIHFFLKLYKMFHNPLLVWHRVSARISKMPVQNSSSKISAHPDWANLLQFPIPTTFNSLSCQKSQFKHRICPERWFVRKILLITLKRSKLKILYRKLLPVQKGGFQEKACPKDLQDGSWLSPWSDMFKMTLMQNEWVNFSHTTHIVESLMNKSFLCVPRERLWQDDGVWEMPGGQRVAIQRAATTQEQVSSHSTNATRLPRTQISDYIVNGF